MREPDGPPTLPELALLLFLVVATWHISADGFRELRHSCFLSRQACADFLGVSVRTVRHWDAGR